MALSATEQISGGRVLDADGRWSVTIATLVSPTYISGGKVLDADGRLVVVID